MEHLLAVVNMYSTLFNALMTFFTIIVSIIAIRVTITIAKKERKILEAEAKRQREQYEESLENQNKQFEVELKRNKEIERLHEQPYLVFKEAKISAESNKKITRIDMLFINKGRGSAYDIIPSLKCTAKTMNGEATLTRCDAIQDPIAMVGEKFSTMWTLGYEKEIVDFLVTIPINYSDASGRKYVRQFDIVFNKSGYASITNFAKPELDEG